MAIETAISDFNNLCHSWDFVQIQKDLQKTIESLWRYCLKQVTSRINHHADYVICN